MAPLQEIYKIITWLIKQEHKPTLMIISLEGRHYSLNTFTSDELSDFTVITGKNGSGKSQLIDLINAYRNSNNNIKVNLLPSIAKHKIQIEDIARHSTAIINNSTWKSKLYYLEQLINKGATYLEISSKTRGADNEAINLMQLLKPYPDLKKIVLEYIAQDLRNINNGRTSEDPEYMYLNHFATKNRINYNYLIDKAHLEQLEAIAVFHCKEVHELEIQDLYNTTIPESLQYRDLFYTQIGEIIYNYSKRRRDNSYSYYLKQRFNHANNSISEDEFEKKHPAPWILINDILSNIGLQYKIDGINIEHFSDSLDYKFYLLNDSNEKIIFEQLSSGEKRIIELIFNTFISNEYSSTLNFPHLLILDEPDAHLHPEMAQVLIDVLYRNFVKKLKMKVIITTHSPSTVALTPEECLFEIKNKPTTTLKKISKDYALNILTGNLPTLNIDYKNHRQVFVESPNDQAYYSYIFDKLHIENCLNYRLYFISNGFGKGSCEQVKKIVDDIRQSGNTSVFGIIDWDSKNQKGNFVHVHGENSIYSIENILYNPIYLIALFIKDGNCQFCKELNIDIKTFDENAIGNEDVEKLQSICDYFFKVINQASNNIDNTLVDIKFYNGKTLKFPKWFAYNRGHDFYDIFVKAFPAIKKYSTDTILTSKLCEIAAKCFPFVPQCTIDVLKEISTR